MRFFNILHNVILEPERFYKKIRTVKTVHHALVFFLVFALYASIFATIAGWSAFKAVYPKFFVTGTLSVDNYIIIFSVLYYMFSVLQSVATAMLFTVLFYFMIRTFGKKITFNKMFNVVAYSYAPAFILTPVVLLLQAVYYQYFFGPLLWISVLIGLPFAAWMIYLQITGASIFVKIDKWHAFFGMYLIPLLFLLVLSTFLVFFSTWFGVLPLTKFA